MHNSPAKTFRDASARLNFEMCGKTI